MIGHLGTSIAVDTEEFFHPPTTSGLPSRPFLRLLTLDVVGFAKLGRGEDSEHRYTRPSMRYASKIHCFVSTINAVCHRCLL